MGRFLQLLAVMFANGSKEGSLSLDQGLARFFCKASDTLKSHSVSVGTSQFAFSVEASVDSKNQMYVAKSQ